MSTHPTTHYTEATQSTASMLPPEKKSTRCSAGLVKQAVKVAATAALADGVLVYYSYYDNSLYAVGKGPSAITVDAPSTSISKGQSIVIRGYVTDNLQAPKNWCKLANSTAYPQCQTKAWQIGWNTSTCKSQCPQTRLVFQ